MIDRTVPPVANWAESIVTRTLEPAGGAAHVLSCAIHYSAACSDGISLKSYSSA